MSALRMVGQVVSQERIEGKSKKTGEAYAFNVNYVVNGGGEPLKLTTQAKLQTGVKIDLAVTARAFRDSVSFVPVDESDLVSKGTERKAA